MCEESCLKMEMKGSLYLDPGGCPWMYSCKCCMPHQIDKCMDVAAVAKTTLSTTRQNTVTTVSPTTTSVAGTSSKQSSDLYSCNWAEYRTYFK